MTISRVALITGATGGIGELIAERLSNDGFAIGVHYSKNFDKANDIVEKIKNGGGLAIAIQGDISDEMEMTGVFDQVEKEFGGVDVVVNTSGIMLLSSIASLNLNDLDSMYRINIRGTFNVAKQAANRVRSGGSIINFSTSITRLQYPTYGAYAASKGAVEAMTLILARELRGKDITANTVAPGPTATPLFLDGKTDEQIAQLASAPPLERLGKPLDISEIVSLLAGPGRWINGQTLFVNGGIV